MSQQIPDHPMFHIFPPPSQAGDCVAHVPRDLCFRKPVAWRRCWANPEKTRTFEVLVFERANQMRGMCEAISLEDVGAFEGTQACCLPFIRESFYRSIEGEVLTEVGVLVFHASLCGGGMVAHEATHLALHVFKEVDGHSIEDIGTRDGEERLATLVGFVTLQVNAFMRDLRPLLDHIHAGLELE